VCLAKFNKTVNEKLGSKPRVAELVRYGFE